MGLNYIKRVSVIAMRAVKVIDFMDSSPKTCFMLVVSVAKNET